MTGASADARSGPGPTADRAEEAPSPGPTATNEPRPPTGAPQTGAPQSGGRFAGVLTELATVDGKPVHEHAEVYTAVHARLQDALTSIDEV